MHINIHWTKSSRYHAIVSKRVSIATGCQEEETETTEQRTKQNTLNTNQLKIKMNFFIISQEVKISVKSKSCFSDGIYNEKCASLFISPSAARAVSGFQVLQLSNNRLYLTYMMIISCPFMLAGHWITSKSKIWYKNF